MVGVIASPPPGWSFELPPMMHIISPVVKEPLLRDHPALPPSRHAFKFNDDEGSVAPGSKELPSHIRPEPRPPTRSFDDTTDLFDDTTRSFNDK
jgi:hypothetical protein